MLHPGKEFEMSGETMFLGLFIVAFVTFGAVLFITDRNQAR
jgi:hypothetical protein